MRLSWILKQLGILRVIFPPILMLFSLVPELVLLFVDYKEFSIFEFLVFFIWIPILSIPYFITGKTYYYSFLLYLIFLNGLFNLIHIILLKCRISLTSIFVLMNSNSQEAIEFLDLKFNYLFILLIPYFLFFIFLLRNRNRQTKIEKVTWQVFIIYSLAFFFIILSIIKKRFVLYSIPQTTRVIVSIFDEYKSFQEVKNRKLITLRNEKNVEFKSQPDISVLIIGESCNRNHMGLYGYSRNTTPILSNRKDIHVFNNVVSAYSNTLFSVLTLFTEVNVDNKMAFDNSLSLIDVFHSSGYKTYWLSNQNPIGVWDNSITNLSNIADVRQFVNLKTNNSFDIINSISYDEKLFSCFSKAIQDTASKKFIVLHLMGSHSTYSKRYPKKFEKFQGDNDKEKVIAEYDNSVLYNDYVVNHFIQVLHNHSIKNGLSSTLVYLSDHGENVFDELDNVGHDFKNNYLPVSNVEIPFVMWVSPKYQSSNRGKVQNIISNLNKPYVSDDTYHTIIDLNFIKIGNFNPTRSLINPLFDYSRPRILIDGKNYDEKNKLIQ